jgi:hypothetical protein
MGEVTWPESMKPLEFCENKPQDAGRREKRGVRW